MTIFSHLFEQHINILLLPQTPVSSHINVRTKCMDCKTHKYSTAEPVRRFCEEYMYMQSVFDCHYFGKDFLTCYKPDLQ